MHPEFHSNSNLTRRSAKINKKLSTVMFSASAEFGDRSSAVTHPDSYLTSCLSQHFTR